ncbi:hypothetical protein EDEG_01161 [Edhazardia aedis USNM 41457]|uniref:Uncharacterized protein n=1 Tax=Edhazardia aedis (strain USNM 41457) TaxID=1003232 RepID=J9DAW6_EDHAE|nr:hypothetical protein EDEG_01161 [Edhazardia aedis USNM 41457]|eukprot:EJW04634.1 hypothetical protein EDEG_01161 [Edhazardia aedis USNM 41457]
MDFEEYFLVFQSQVKILLKKWEQKDNRVFILRFENQKNSCLYIYVKLISSCGLILLTKK